MSSWRDKLLITRHSCSVTLYDMKAELLRDGRERGIWVWLRDDSRALPEAKRRIGALKEFLDYLKVPEKEQLGAMLRFDSLFQHMFVGNVNEAALLEWPAARLFAVNLMEELKKRRKVEVKARRKKRGPPRARDVRKWANDPPLYPGKARKKGK